MVLPSVLMLFVTFYQFIISLTTFYNLLNTSQIVPMMRARLFHLNSYSSMFHYKESEILTVTLGTQIDLNF